MQQMVPIAQAQVVDFLAWMKLNHPQVQVRLLSSEAYSNFVKDYHVSQGTVSDAIIDDWAKHRDFVEYHDQQQ